MAESESREEVTQLLRGWRSGDHASLEALTPIVYRELRQIAAARMRRERPGHTLQPTALINEAYLRLIGQNMPEFGDRGAFFALSARIMRQVLVDSARAHLAGKRGSGQQAPFEESLAVVDTDGAFEDVLDLNHALERLAATDERRARVIELRYFGGLEREAIAEATGMSVATVKRDLTLAQAWLRRELSGNRDPKAPPL